MLHLADITANLDVYTAGLIKRNLPQASELLAKVIKLDEDRKATQHKLDNNLAEANLMAKQIGGLMKEGKKKKRKEPNRKQQS